MEEGETIFDGEDQDECYQNMSSRHDKEAEPIKSEQCGCLKTTCIITAPVHLPTQMKEILHSPIPR